MSPQPTPTNHASTAWHALGGTLTELAEEGRTTPCQVDPAPFVSESRADREEAAQACSWCPALTACARYADAADEGWLVWGGADRTPQPRGRKSMGVAA